MDYVYPLSYTLGAKVQGNPFHANVGLSSKWMMEVGGTAEVLKGFTKILNGITSGGELCSDSAEWLESFTLYYDFRPMD